MTWKTITLCLAVWTGEVAAAEVGSPLKVDAPSVAFLEDVQIPAREAGLVVSMQLREGQTVQRGDLLARLEDTRAQLTLQRAKLNLEKAQFRAGNDHKIRMAQKALRLAQVEERRGLDSQARRAQSISGTELARLRHAVEVAELTLEQARTEVEELGLEVAAREHDVEAAEHEVQRHRLHAPFSGVIAKRLRNRGEWVEPGQAVYRLVSVERLRVSGYLPADQADKTLVGKPAIVRFTSEGTPREARGKVAFVSPEADPNTTTVRVWAAIENSDLRLRPGTPVEMVIQP